VPGSDPAEAIVTDEAGRNGGIGHSSGTPDPEPAHPDPQQDPYRGVVRALVATAVLGSTLAIAGSVWLENPVVFDAAVTLGLSAAILIGVARMQAARLKPPKGDEGAPIPPPPPDAGVPAETPVSTGPQTSGSPPSAPATSGGLAAYLGIGFSKDPPARSRPNGGFLVIWRWFRDLGEKRLVGLTSAGYACIVLPLMLSFPTTQLGPLAAGIAAAGCLAAAGLAATAARYLAALDPAGLPEAPRLTQGARVAGWVLALAAVSIGMEWAGQQTIVRIMHFGVLALNAALCIGVLTLQRPKGELPRVFRLDLGLLSALGSRTNILASVLDAAERQLGIDLRSTWALTVVRSSLEPLVIGLCLLAWFSTSATVVGLSEQGLVERLGVPLQDHPLMPGLHLHWPWPVDRVFLIPVMRVQGLTVGHEGAEGGGPEDVLWARQHAANEYTLLLGNGRDLITVDAAVQFRIADARAWRYRCQNPADALRAIAYRSVMRSTVNRTLSEALSENVVTLTGRMRSMVQQDADALGLGVEVLAFTVGGMHPPVMVATAYQAVVSAELGKVTSVVGAQAYRDLTVPFAESAVLVSGNMARADGAETLAQAAGQAWSFRTLETQYRAAPREFFFRRRLETLEKGLGLRGRFTVVDARFQRDGGELWVMP